MKVLFTPHLPHYTIGLTKELAKHVDIKILTTQKYNTPAKHLPIPNIPKLRGLIKITVLKTAGLFYDIVHANTSQEAIHCLNKNKLIVTEHGYPDPQVAGPKYEYYMKEKQALIALHEAGVPIIAISNFAAKMLKEKIGVKAHKVIYHGLLEQFKTNTPKKLDLTKPPVILWVSRLIQLKEPFIFLQALTKLANKTEYKAIMVGDGPLKNQILQYIKKHGLKNKITLKTKIPFHQMPTIYSKATILVHTSRIEAFGFSVLEAMGIGLPVIVPKAGGAYEVAGQAAITFTPGNPTELAEKITQILTDPEQYHKQSQKSIQRAQQFTWTKTAQQYLQEYKKLHH